MSKTDQFLWAFLFFTIGFFTGRVVEAIAVGNIIF